MRHKKFLGLLLLFFFTGAGLIFTQLPRPVEAASGNVSGAAWNSNLGWISFKGEDYSVNFVRDQSDPTGVKGTFSHNSYAWSSNVGWINFSSDYPGPYPEAPNHGVQVESNGLVTGWARSCSVFVTGCSGSLRPLSETGGWDGWIKMSGSWADGVSYNSATGKLDKFAWGSDVVGWIDFCNDSAEPGADHCVTVDSLSPICSASPNPAELSGGTVSVTWEADEPLPLTDYNFSWVWSDGTTDTGSNPPAKTYNNSQAGQTITGTLTATKISDPTKTGTGVCSVNITNPSQKTIQIEFGGTRASSGNVSDGGGLNCLNGVSCSKTYNLGDIVTLNANVTPGHELPPLNAIFQGWGGGLCSGTGSCGPITITASMPFLNIVTASFIDSTTPPSSATLDVSPPWTRILEQNAGSLANSSVVNVTINNTGTSAIDVCLAEIKSKVDTTKTLDVIVRDAKRDVGDPRTSNETPKCTFGGTQGNCFDNCVNGISPGTSIVLPFFITIPEKFYEIKANSPYDVKIEARDGLTPFLTKNLEFRYQVRDVLPR